jgi:YVTN family beta-propeller protein
MKSRWLLCLLALGASILLLLPCSTLAQTADILQSRAALLQWYPQTLSLPNITNTHSACFDGANVWVTSYDSNTASKVRATTGKVLGTFPAGSGAAGCAFDGANIWVADFLSGTVTKINASSGATVGTFSTSGVNPYDVIFDGTYIWVSNNGSGTVAKIVPASGTLVSTYSVGASYPHSMAFDGTYIWVTVQANTPWGMAFDGVNIWVTDNGSDTVTELLASSGAVEATITVGSSPVAVTFDGIYIWVGNEGSNTLTKLLASSGAVISTYPVGGAGGRKMAFDSANIWMPWNTNVTKIPTF